MTYTEHLLTILSEECAEVSQRISKALRFGLREVQPEQPLTNAERIVEELADVWAVVQLLEDRGAFKARGIHFRDLMEAKKVKVEKFMEYAETCGTVDASKEDDLAAALKNLVDRVTSEVWMGVDEVAFIRHQAKDQIEAAEALL